jgi:hypothetical protein
MVQTVSRIWNTLILSLVHLSENLESLGFIAVDDEILIIGNSP